MIPEERRERILDKLNKEEICSIKSLAKEFGVSRITIMRDLNILEKNGLVTKVHGGVKIKKNDNNPFGPETRFNYRLKQNYEKKLQIAKKAVAFVKDGTTIFIDSSTTAHMFSLELFKNKYIDLNIVTNSPTIIAEALKLPDIKIISTGGELNSSFSMFGGTWVTDFLDRINIDTAYISTAGISRELNIITSNMELANILKKVIEKSDEINLLVDSSKFFRKEMLNVSTIRNFTRIITDDAIDAEHLKLLKGAGPDIVY
jgi:DeoR/GlpR family transcriptional regulator of sugar metabolism